MEQMSTICHLKTFIFIANAMCVIGTDVTNLSFKNFYLIANAMCVIGQMSPICHLQKFYLIANAMCVIQNGVSKVSIYELLF
jgi:hypothetical protein